MSAVASVLPFHWAKLQGDDGKKLEETGCFLLCLFCNLLIIKYYPPLWKNSIIFPAWFCAL